MKKRGIGLRLKGVVLRSKMPKTAIVEVKRLVRHPLYKKVLKKRKRYMVHDEHNKCKPGDKVEIIECRPLSRRKRFRILQIIS
jgi:small subunit ribosomal protein S17